MASGMRTAIPSPTMAKPTTAATTLGTASTTANPSTVKTPPTRLTSRGPNRVTRGSPANRPMIIVVCMATNTAPPTAAVVPSEPVR